MVHLALFQPDVEQLKVRRDIGGLIKALHARDYDTRKSAADALLSIGAPAVSSLVSALAEENVNVRVLSSWVLAELAKQPSALFSSLIALMIPALIKALSDQNSTVRCHAALSLGEIGDDRAIPPLVACLKDPDPLVRQHATVGTGSLSTRTRDARLRATAVASLIQGMKDPNIDVRMAAITSLGMLGDPGATDAIITAARDRNHDARAKAVEALILLDEPAIIPMVFALNDKDPVLRDALEPALVQITGMPVADLLTEMLSDPRSEVRCAAARAIGRNGETSGMAPLVKALQHPDAELRLAAADSLDILNWKPDRIGLVVDFNISRRQWDSCIEIGAPAVVPLIRLLADDDPNISAAAEEALVKMGKLSHTPLVEKLQDGNLLVRGKAARILDRTGCSPIKGMIAGLNLHPLGNRKRLGFVEGKDCHAYLVLFSDQAEAEHYYEAFVSYAHQRHVPFVIEVMVAHLPKIMFPEKYAFVLPYFGAGARPGYHEWAKEAILACNGDLGQRKYTAGRYGLLQGVLGSVILWDILLPSGFDAGTGEARELLSDPPGMGYTEADLASAGKVPLGKPCPDGPWIGVLYDFSKISGPDCGESAVKELLDLAGAHRLAGCVIHGGVFQEKYWCIAIHSSSVGHADQIRLAVLGSTLEAAGTRLALDITPVLNDAPAEVQALPYQGYVAESGKYVGP